MSSDRVYIVTGAARGIGLACAQRLIEDGHRVVLADMDSKSGKQAGIDLAEGNDRAVFVECDVSEPLAVHRTNTQMHDLEGKQFPYSSTLDCRHFFSVRVIRGRRGWLAIAT